MSETKDWRKICADCQEGEPPKDCEYFGEPGGCNAKTMGKHPTCKDSLQVGDTAAMRKALERLREWVLMDLNENAFIADSSGNYMKLIKGTIEIANAALAKPPRNCDLYKTLDDARNAFFADYVPDETCSSATAFAIWLFDEAKGANK